MNHPVLEQFDAICKIPRPSHHEEKIAQYLYNWAKQRNLFVAKDDYNNILMRKNASVGNESKSTIAMQAHMDMVCEKVVNYEHDFLKDPIKYYIDGNIVSTHNTTTLGADNGIGVATILAILNDDALSHPELEAIFTVDEEEDFTGAINFDVGTLKANYLINVDHAVEDEIICASAGGIGCKMSKTLKFIKNTQQLADVSLLKVNLVGLKGGHSGEDINRGRGNSIILLFRLLNAIKDQVDVLEIKGGSTRTAIPRDVAVTIAVSNAQLTKVTETINQLSATFANEYIAVKDNLAIEVEKLQTKAYEYIDKTDLCALIKLVLLMPDGIAEMNDEFYGIVKSSMNLGIIYFEDQKIHLISEIRSSKMSSMEFIKSQVQMLCELLGFNFEEFSRYNSWEYSKDSKLRQLALEAFQEVQQQPITPIVLHAGLECGFFKERKPSLDIIAVGPNCRNFHSPTEEFEIDSMDRTYRSIIRLLEKIDF